MELSYNKDYMVTKRDGKLEEFSSKKLYEVLLWACEDNVINTENILKALQIRLYDGIRIEVLFDEVIDTVYNLINRVTPFYETVVKRLYIQKMYKQIWSMNRDIYPHLKTYLDAVTSVLISIENYFTEEEINQLSVAIEPSRDMLSTYLGLRTFFDKDSIKINGAPKELLQHGYMRLAMQAYLNDISESRIEKIINRYNNLSLGIYTEATPKWKNSLRPKYQAASCCVHYMSDNTESINKVTSDVGQYSRFDGGNAADTSALRASGSKIGTKGVSSGPIPFIRKLQASVEAFNQSGSRPGICIVTFQWWHADVMSLLKLMDEGGKENQRARNLKYTIKLNRLFLRAIENDDYVYIFDPKRVPELLHTYGEEFDSLYQKAVNLGKYKEKILARSIAYEIAVQRSEVGNLYTIFSENVNEQSPFNDIIYSSNACMEIFLPTKSAKNTRSLASIDLNKSDYLTTTKEDTGLTALCNLSSINVEAWMKLSQDGKDSVAAELLEASDNQIDDQYYPTVDGEVFNKNYRAIGIGQTNLAYYFAKRNIKFSSNEALLHQENISKSIFDTFRKASKDLALIRGNFPWYNRTDLKEPSRFATLFAVAPTASSSLKIGATEGIEPVAKLIAEKTGTFSTKQLAPEIGLYGSNYELAKDIPTKALYDLAAIRNKYLDQGQSMNTYTKDNTSAYEVIQDIIYAEKIGLKSQYYLQSSTSVLDECEGCAS